MFFPCAPSRDVPPPARGARPPDGRGRWRCAYPTESGYWIDEGIAVDASHDFVDIPSTLVMDGSPPLYYLLLHGWMAIFGETEAATRALSLVFALVAVPVAYWAGNAVFDRHAGVLAAIGIAACLLLNYYAQGDEDVPRRRAAAAGLGELRAGVPCARPPRTWSRSRPG